MTMQQRRSMHKAILVLVMILAACFYIYPVFLMFVNSVKPFGEIVSDAIAFPTQMAWENYGYVIDKIDYFKLFANNVIITVTGIVAFSSVAAYILDRRKNRYSRIAYTIIITPMLIPFQTIMITLLKSMNVLHLSGSKLGLGVQYWGFGIPMATFIFYNFMKTIPKEIDESAVIDGASTFRSIIFPLLKSVTVTVIVLDVMAAYTFVGQMNTKWHYAMTAMVLAVVPSILIFIFLQKYIVDGVVAGAVKG